MIYIFIDESGDFGEMYEIGSSVDFAMAACVCHAENLEDVSWKIKKFCFKLRKKELKFSKMSSREVSQTKNFLKDLEIESFSVCIKKTRRYYGEGLLRRVFQELISNISIDENQKIKVFIDGSENTYFRKLYEPIVRKKFSRVVLKFANSMKTPMIQAADFYAGQARKANKGN